MIFGITGGIGMERLKAFDQKKIHNIDTPFGKTPSRIVEGVLEGMPVLYIDRRGEFKNVPDAKLDHRSSIYALKKLGASCVISFTSSKAVSEKVNPGDAVIVDQFISFRSEKAQTFFDDGIVARIPFDEPVCSELSALAEFAAAKAITLAEKHRNAAVRRVTCLIHPGPESLTAAEKKMFSMLGVDIVSSVAPGEAALAREAGLCYAMVSLANGDPDIQRANGELALQILRGMARGAGAMKHECPCSASLEKAILTPKSKIPPAVLDRLSVILEGRF